MKKMKRETYDRIAVGALVVLLAGLLIFAFASDAFACPEIHEEPGTVTFAGTSYWAREDESLELAGKFRPDEDVRKLTVQKSESKRVRGFFYDGRMIRSDAEVKLMCLGERLVGLTVLDNVVLQFNETDFPFVQEIVWAEMGDEVEICSGSISFCILHVSEDGYATERLYTKHVDWWPVGKAFFNIDIADFNDWMTIAIGDWDNDGELELGLVAGSAPEVPTESETVDDEKEEPTGDPAEKPENESNKTSDGNSGCGEMQTNTEPVKKQDCWKIEFNLHFLIQHCRKVFGL